MYALLLLSSIEAKSWIASALQPENRFTPVQALKHSWLASISI